MKIFKAVKRSNSSWFFACGVVFSSFSPLFHSSLFLYLDWVSRNQQLLMNGRFQPLGHTSSHPPVHISSPTISVFFVHIYRVSLKKRLFCDSCSTGGSGMIQRVIYQSRTLSNILFFIEHTFLKRHCVTGVFVVAVAVVVASGIGAAAFTSQVSE